MTGKTILLGFIICVLGLGVGMGAGWVQKKFQGE